MPSPRPQNPDDDISELLNAERELTQTERDRLRELTIATWAQLYDQAGALARSTYSVATSGQFAACVREHLDVEQMAALAQADVYQCPVCERLLKDRGISVRT